MAQSHGSSKFICVYLGTWVHGSLINLLSVICVSFSLFSFCKDYVYPEFLIMQKLGVFLYQLDARTLKLIEHPLSDKKNSRFISSLIHEFESSHSAGCFVGAAISSTRIRGRFVLRRGWVR